MIGQRLDEITKADIDSLVGESVEEGSQLEFKRDLPGNKDGERKEFAADISSFANARGGYIVWGVDEQNGKAVAAEGVAVGNVAEELRRLEQRALSNIEPRIAGLRFRAIEDPAMTTSTRARSRVLPLVLLSPQGESTATSSGDALITWPRSGGGNWPENWPRNNETRGA